jgi:hypothetical protein
MLIGDHHIPWCWPITIHNHTLLNWVPIVFQLLCRYGLQAVFSSLTRPMDGLSGTLPTTRRWKCRSPAEQSRQLALWLWILMSANNCNRCSDDRALDAGGPFLNALSSPSVLLEIREQRNKELTNDSNSDYMHHPEVSTIWGSHNVTP